MSVAVKPVATDYLRERRDIGTWSVLKPDYYYKAFPDLRFNHFQCECSSRISSTALQAYLSKSGTHLAGQASLVFHTKFHRVPLRPLHFTSQPPLIQTSWNLQIYLETTFTNPQSLFNSIARRLLSSWRKINSPIQTSQPGLLSQNTVFTTTPQKHFQDQIKLNTC